MANCRIDPAAPAWQASPMKYLKIIVALLLALAVLATSFLDVGAGVVDPLLAPRK